MIKHVTINGTKLYIAVVTVSIAVEISTQAVYISSLCRFSAFTSIGHYGLF